MTAPKTAEKVCRGTPSQSAQVPYSVVSLISTSPTSNTTARRVGDEGRDGSAGIVKLVVAPSVLDRQSLLVRPALAGCFAHESWLGWRGHDGLRSVSSPSVGG